MFVQALIGAGAVIDVGIGASVEDFRPPPPGWGAASEIAPGAEQDRHFCDVLGPRGLKKFFKEATPAPPPVLVEPRALRAAPLSVPVESEAVGGTLLAPAFLKGVEHRAM